MANVDTFVDQVIEKMLARDPNQPEFIQAAEEVRVPEESPPPLPCVRFDCECRSDDITLRAVRMKREATGIYRTKSKGRCR
eukprot:1188908-Prorocentrum_minimum.AAC.6